jgi:hypothetical protein
MQTYGPVIWVGQGCSMQKQSGRAEIKYFYAIQGNGCEQIG